VLGQEPLHVLDFGCGGLAALRLLLSSGHVVSSYLGVDLCCPPAPEVQGVKISLIEGDISSVRIGADAAVNTFIAVNSLCYIPQLDEVLATANSARSGAGGARFVVVEPRGSILWEAYFNGVRIFFRSPAAFRRAFASAGWRLQWSGALYAFKLGDFFLWPVAQIYAFVTTD